MGITNALWLERIRKRGDIVSFVTHLTRVGPDEDPLANLYAILNDRKLKGSSKTGFIVGTTPAVCFQDAPLSGICANILAEEAFREENPETKLRYSAIGLSFKKTLVYQRGGRPVFYEQKSIAQALLPATDHWRIVSFDLSAHDDLIDWSHEREWRVRNDFVFAPKSAMVLLPNSAMVLSFIDNVQHRCGIKASEFAGLVNLDIVTA